MRKKPKEKRSWKMTDEEIIALYEDCNMAFARLKILLPTRRKLAHKAQVKLFVYLDKIQAIKDDLLPSYVVFRREDWEAVRKGIVSRKDL